MASGANLPRVTVLGLGNMGSALADRLVTGGLDVAVWNRSPGRAKPYGDRATQSVQQALDQADVVLVCLRDHAATVATLTDQTALPDATLVVLSSMTADESRDLGCWAERHGIAYLEARIQDYPSTVREGNATIVCSGPIAVFEAARPALAALSAHLHHVSEALGGAATLAAAQLAFAFHVYVGALHGAAMCRSADMDPEMFLRLMILDYMKVGPLPADIEKMVMSAITRRFDDDVGATLDVWRLALQQLIAENREAGLDTGHLEAIDNLVADALAKGHGEHDFEAVSEIIDPCRRPGTEP